MKIVSSGSDVLCFCWNGTFVFLAAFGFGKWMFLNNISILTPRGPDNINKQTAPINSPNNADANINQLIKELENI